LYGHLLIIVYRTMSAGIMGKQLKAMVIGGLPYGTNPLMVRIL